MLDDWEIDDRLKWLTAIQGAASIIQPIANQAKQAAREKEARMRYQAACYRLRNFLDYVNSLDCHRGCTSLGTLDEDIKQARRVIDAKKKCVRCRSLGI